MKKLIFLFLFFSGLLFSQTYHAGVTVYSIYWHNSTEWGANLHGDLWDGDVMLIPGVDYDTTLNTYTWRVQNESGGWNYSNTQTYTEHTDGDANAPETWEVKIHGPGISTDWSNPVAVVKNGTPQYVQIDRFNSGGGNVNSNTIVYEWAEGSWFQYTLQNHYWLTQDEDNYLKDTVIVPFGQNFYDWVNTDNNDLYYTNFTGIHIGSGPSATYIDVNHKPFYGVTFNSGNFIPSTIKLSDPWYVNYGDPDYLEGLYGCRNLGVDAIPEIVENGVNYYVVLNQSNPPAWGIRHIILYR
jgi:hypothetical protein